MISLSFTGLEIYKSCRSVLAGIKRNIYKILIRLINTISMFRILILCLTWLTLNLFSLKAQEYVPKPDLPVEASISHGSNDELIIYITGDGGWNTFNGQLVNQMEHLGYGVVALNSRKYFWSMKSPEIFAKDIEQLTKYYLAFWKKSTVIIVGYSFGADVASFLPGLLTEELKNKIKQIVLISPSASTDFVIRISDLVGETENTNRRYLVKPEIDQIGLPVICTFGKAEAKVLKTTFAIRKNLTTITLEGDHRYNNDFKLLIKTIGMKQ